jgi:hypothetical protein
MKHCPTCGQIILPSMGKKTQKIANAITQTPQNPPTITIEIDTNGTKHTLDTQTTPRGYRGTKTIRTPNGPYRLRTNLLHLPRKKAITGHLTTIHLPNAQNHTPTKINLPPQPTNHPTLPITHTWENLPLTLPGGETTNATLTITVK